MRLEPQTATNPSSLETNTANELADKLAGQVPPATRMAVTRRKRRAALITNSTMFQLELLAWSGLLLVGLAICFYLLR